MEEKNNAGGVVVGLALLALVGWEWWKSNKGSAANPGSAATPAIANAGATTLSNVNYPSSGTTAPSLTNPAGIPVVQNPDNGISLPAGITQTQYNIVNQWAMSESIPPAYALWQAQVPADYATIVDLQTNVWQTSGVPTPAQAAAWQQIIATYDPNHKYW